MITNFKLNAQEVKMALADSTSSTLWTGVDLDGFYSKLFFESTAIQNFKKFLNIKSKAKIAKMDAASIIQDDGDTFSSSNATVSQKQIEVAPKRINLTMPISVLEQGFISTQLQAGSQTASFSTGDFLNYVVDFAGRLGGQDIEKLTWSASDSEGLLYKIAADTATTRVTATTVTSSNVLAEIGKVYSAASPNVLGRPDAVIYVASNVMKAYKIAFGTSALSNGGFATLLGEYNYLGIKIVEAKGMADNRMVLSYNDNLAFSTDLEDDYKNVNVLDMTQTTGDAQLRVVARFKVAFDYIISEEVVAYY